MHKSKTVGKRRNNKFKLDIIITTILFAILFLLIITPINAFEASGGNIYTRNTHGTISLENNNSHIIGGSIISSTYTNGIIEGYFGINNLENTDSTPPLIIINSPTNNTISIYSEINFNFSVTDNSGIENCTLYINSTAQNTTYSPINGINNIGLELSGGNYIWDIECYDTNNNHKISENRHLKIILASNFDNDTTDLSSVNISSVPNLTIAKSGKGKIKFNDNINFENVTNLNEYITIENFSVSIDSNALPTLNKSAQITIYNVPYQNIVILKDGRVCNTCNIISQSLGSIIFNVSGFSTYTVSSSSKLEIFDDSDAIEKQILEDIGFYANYSNVSSYNSIDSSCEISFDINGWTTPQLMNYNISSKLHEYHTTFNVSGTYNFNITCIALEPAFDNLSLIESFSQANISAGSLANINIINSSSSRFDDTRLPSEINATSGNVSEIELDIITTSAAWQGYYGTINNIIILSDISGNKLYDWNKTTILGEIMATRSTTIDWSDIKCIQQNSLINEEIYIQKNSSDPDSVNMTFNMTNHPSFMINSNILSGCKSTRIFRATEQTGSWNIVVSDSLDSSIYVGILNTNTNFKNTISDFEILVPVTNNIIETYYFYLEVN